MVARTQPGSTRDGFRPCAQSQRRGPAHSLHDQGAVSSAAAITNFALAANLREYSDLLEQQGADSFRISAYRRAAGVLEHLDRPATELLAKGGRDALEALPAIGRSTASAIAEMIVTGRWSQLDRLRGWLEPEALFRTIAGIGPELASRIHSDLHVETLEGLEMAAHDGRLESLTGFGRRRLQMVRAALAERLGRPRLHQLRSSLDTPGVATLLDVDREYREQAAIGALQLISPRRFNPKGEAWLPVLHTRRGPWEFTALYSNTARTHELGRSRDWVVIYFHRGDTPENQCTIVTQRYGPLAECRVVRGREEECGALLARNVSERV
jgi:hypothetical protein